MPSVFGVTLAGGVIDRIDLKLDKSSEASPAGDTALKLYGNCELRRAAAIIRGRARVHPLLSDIIDRIIYYAEKRRRRTGCLGSSIRPGDVSGSAAQISSIAGSDSRGVLSDRCLCSG